MKRNSAGFLILCDSPLAWVSDDRHRVIVQRADNRFQAYERLEGEFLSVGYPVTRDAVRLFLKGHAVEMYPGVFKAARGEAPVFRHPSLTTF